MKGCGNLLEFPEQYKDNATSSTGLLFIKAYNKWHSKIKDALKKFGITHPQFVVMTTLAYLSQSNEYVTQAMIAKMAEMDVMTVSKIAKILETNGFIQRSPNPKDVRANAVSLLPKGDDMVNKTFPIVVNLDEHYFGVLNQSEGEFQELLQKLLLF